MLFVKYPYVVFCSVSLELKYQDERMDGPGADRDVPKTDMIYLIFPRGTMTAT